MKRQIVLLGFIFFMGLSYAQNPIEKGQGQFNAGIGFSSWGVPVYLGFYIWNHEGNYAGPHASGLELGAQVGGRYYFTDKFGLNMELGGSNSFSGGKFGISVRL